MTVLAENRREELFWGLNAVIALGLGTVLFCIVNSSYFFSLTVMKLFGPGHAAFLGSPIAKKIFTAVFVYGRDFLWAYALMFAVCYFFRDSFKMLKKGMAVVLTFELLLGIWKLSVHAGGAFDPVNIAVVLGANLLACLVIMIHERVIV